MTDVTGRLASLSLTERALLFERLREKREREKRIGRAAREEGAPAPLSFAQQRLWFLDRLAPGSPLYNIPAALHLSGRLDPAVLAACFGEIVRRHEALRTRFEIREGGPVQVVAPAEPFPLPVIDLSALSPDLRAPEEERRIEEEAGAPFDLANPPLLRARLVRLGASEHLLLLTVHHIASDAWSLGVAVAELGALYPAFAAGRPSPLPELPVQYADFARAERERLGGEALAREVAFWRGKLAGAEPPDLPTDRPRPAAPTFSGAGLDIVLPRPLDEGLRAWAQSQRATLFMTLLAPFSAFLARITGGEDVVLGTTVTGRGREAVAKLIGFFINTLVLRTGLAGDPDGREILARARATALEAFTHRELPFEKLVEELGLPRDPHRPPLLRFVLQLLNLPAPDLALPGLAITPRPLPREVAKFDLLVNVVDVPGGLRLEWRYDTDLFEGTTIARLSRSFEILLAGLLEDPGRRLSDLPLLAASERHQLVAEWNEGPAGEESGRFPIHHLFEAQVDRTPDAVAVSQGPERLTYRELDVRANRLARHLAALGIQPGDLVALVFERSLAMIEAILATLKAGAGYLPLDPAYPEERRAFALADSDARLVLTAERLEAEREAIAARSGERLAVPTDPELPAYVIYTSGSTGRPKGVVIPHGNVTRLFAATAPWFGFGPDDVWTLFHSYAFDFSVWEIWGALLHGGRLVVVPFWETRSPRAFYDLVRAEKVTVLNQTPSAFRQLLWAEESVLEGAAPDLALRFVIFGGEALEPGSLAPWLARHGDERPLLVNMYGITETTVHVTYRPLRREDLARGSVIGRPIPDLSLHVLDRSLRPQPMDVPGEICVGGQGLALGYLGRPELTAERFVPDPFGPPGSRLYRSGDLARRLPDGDVEYLGRIDHQVKIRGFRIEPGEIEAALSRHPAVREAVAAVRGDRLVAWIVPVSGEAPSLSEIRAFLADSLPEPMLPGALAVLDALPLTVNGKVDRRALPDPDAAPAPQREHRPPRTERELFLAGLFAEVLKLPPDRPVGLDDDFFELGGTSITGAILVNRLQEALGEIVHVVVIFDAPTVAQLAAYVEEQHPRAAEREARPAERPAGPADFEQMRRLIALGRSPRAVEEGPKNPPAVFVLSPPRSGSTLLRVMLAGHPRLFAPPELELLSFGTLAERRAAFSGRDAFWLEGVTRAVMEALGCGAEEAERTVAERERLGWSTLRFYRELQDWIGDRLLVDKTPSYALDPEVLRRAEEGFDGALYLHLVRHPRAVVRSFEEAKLDQIFFRREHPFSRRKLAELIWTVSQQNILDFLAGVPPERQRTVHFEDLVRDPERVLAGICDLLGIDFRPEMADPYRPGAARMTDGVHAVSRMLGDVKLLTYSRVEPAAAERWREEEEAVSPLGTPTLELARTLGYEEGPKTAPLSFSQERLWFLDRLMPGVATYNLPTPFRLRGPLDPAVLARAFGEIVRRHEALRTRFEERDGTPVQVIDPPGPWPLPLVDLTGVPEEEASRLTAEEAGRPFDLERGPLFRTTLLRLSPLEHGLLVNAHHVVTDGWSVRVLAKELAALYAAFAAGRPSPLPELPAQYADFAHWQRERLSGAELERQVAYWRERLGDDPPALDLPLDRPRPALQTYRGASATLVLPPDLSDGLRRLGLASRASLFMTLLAGFEVLLHRQSGQDDVLVGTPVAGRVRAEVEDLIGFFLNTLVLRTDLSGNPTFRELLLRVRETALGAYAHQEVPFEKLLEVLQPERDLSRTPLFQVFFNLANFPDLGAELPGGLTVEPLGGFEAESKFDLTVYAAETGDGIRLHLVYNADLFDASRTEEMLRQYRAVLERAVEEPEARVDEIPLVTPEAAPVLPDPRALLGDEWRGAVHELFLEHARRHPERPAVSDPDGSWTYGELARAVDGLAARLREAGVEKGDRVAVWAHRSAPVVWAVMGTLRAGAAFVMLDPAYPAARIVEMLRLAGPRAFLQIAAAGDPPDEVEAWLRETGCWRLTLRRGGLSLPETAPAVEIGPDDLAYVAFTSGSTGVPKGILGRHGPLSHFIPWQVERFGLTGEDRYSLLSGLAHDPLQRDIFTPLATGASLAAPAPDDLLAPGRLAAWAAREGITVAHLTPALGRVLTEDAPAGIPSLRWVLLVGDVLTRLDVDRLRRIAPSVTCVNLYGSTETQRAVAFHVVEKDGAAQVLPLGRGMRDVQLLVLRPAGPPALAGIGEVGEICVRSPHLAAGYLGDEAGTRERFRANPFTGRPGDRIYRTGDLGRYRPDGQVTFAGRADQQVKVRGFRIELGEIEAALGRLSGVKEAVVLALPEGEDRRLVAFVVGETTVDLRQALAAKLPAYMVPSAFVRLERMPVTPNGKVDRRALAALKDQAEGARESFVPPRTPAERQMIAIWAGVLGLAEDRVGIHDSFFELGGHSLLATRLASRVRAAFGADLPLRALFEAPTVAALTAVVLAEERRGMEEPIVRRSAAEAPLSFSQERLWFLERLTPGTGMYNLPGAARLRGPLDLAALETAFGEIVRRHETLRTRFEVRAGLPVQVVAPPAPWSLPLVDLSGLSDSRRESERLAAEEAARSFDLQGGRLLRTTLLRLGPREHALLVTVHHIASDGWSQRLLFRELAAGYAGVPLPELALQYADYAVWQRERLAGEALERQLAFWRERLGDRPAPLDLPLDRPRPAIQTFRGAAVAAALPRGLSERLQALSVAESASLFMVLLAGFELLLHRQSGQDDVVVGTPVAGRLRPEVEDLIGFFLNTLVLRTDLSGRPTFRELVRRVRETALSAYAHQDVPFERLLQEIQPERDLSRTPLFQVFFNMLNLPPAEARLPSGLAIEPLGTGAGDAKFDLTVYAAQGEEGIGFNLVYNADLFDEARIEELLRQYRALLAQAVERPDAPVDGISLVTPEAVALLPDPRAPLGDAWRGAVHALFAERARRHPERPAVTDPEGTTTYGELAYAVRRLAAHLRTSGVEKGDRVAIWAHRSAPVAWAVLATLEAGAAFVMLDPAYPAPRIVEMLELAAPRAFLAIAAAGDPPPEVEAWLAGAGLSCRVTLPGGGPRGARDLVAGLPQPLPPVEVGPDDLAYVAFTSGSTGTPKGILGRHGPLSHFLPWQAERFGLGPGDRYSLLSGLAHDPLQRDLFTPLCLGGSLAAPSFEEIATPGRLAAWMAREGVTVAHLTPALGQLLTEPPGRGAEPAVIPSLRWVLLVGDVLTRLDVDRIRRIAPNVTCVNLYGSTETQRAVAFHVVEAGSGRMRQVLPLGRGMEDVQLLVVRPGEEPALAGVGEVGEIWVRSPHLAAGYLGDPGLTGDRFRANPWTGAPGDRVYRTGDLGRYLPDGEADFAGRADLQVKIRGFRIEPGEIEAALGRLPGVREAVVIARQDGPNGSESADRRLVAYVVPDPASPPAVESLREALRAKLPAYMVPSAFVLLEKLPLTPNRKVDRRALPAPEAPGAGAGFVEPGSDLERTIAEVWREVLGLPRVGVQSNFFDLGGHSLLLVRLHARLQEALGRDLALVDLFNYPNIRALAEHLGRQDRGSSGLDEARSRGQRQQEAARRQRELARARRGPRRSTDE